MFKKTILNKQKQQNKISFLKLFRIKQVVQLEKFKLLFESLILAQGERW